MVVMKFAFRASRPQPAARRAAHELYARTAALGLSRGCGSDSCASWGYLDGAHAHGLRSFQAPARAKATCVSARTDGHGMLRRRLQRTPFRACTAPPDNGHGRRNVEACNAGECRLQDDRRGTRRPAAAAVATAASATGATHCARLTYPLPAAQESERLKQAFEKEEFRKLFHDYLDEISNPEHRKEYEAYISQLEGDSQVPAGMQLVRPQPGFAVKTHDDRGQKVFVNICHSEEMELPATSRVAGSSGKAGVQWSLPHAVGNLRHEVDKSACATAHGRKLPCSTDARLRTRPQRARAVRRWTCAFTRAHCISRARTGRSETCLLAPPSTPRSDASPRRRTRCGSWSQVRGLSPRKRAECVTLQACTHRLSRAQGRGLHGAHPRRHDGAQVGRLLHHQHDVSDPSAALNSSLAAGCGAARACTRACNCCDTQGRLWRTSACRSRANRCDCRFKHGQHSGGAKVHHHAQVRELQSCALSCLRSPTCAHLPVLTYLRSPACATLRTLQRRV